jgi:hypothetical protein
MFSAVNFFQFLLMKTPDLDPTPEPDPDWYGGSGIKKSGSETLLKYGAGTKKDVRQLIGFNPVDV